MALMLAGCASLTSPNGGPKDTKPPIPDAQKTIPSNNQTNFNGKSVQLVFNEPVKLNNPKEEIIISPSPGKVVDIRVKGSKVIITPEEPWKQNTTYSIVPRDGIQDVTESNSPTNLKLAFSTGPIIDSLSISGQVKNLLLGTAADKITVGIYSQDTFNIFSNTPTYFTKTDKAGKYQIGNIKAGTYRIYAFDDKNKNLKVESRTERYGFLADSINLTASKDSLNIGLVMMDSRPLKISSIRNVGTITRLRFSKYLADYNIKSDQELTHAFGDNQTEVVIWNPPGDSLKITLSATDSIQSQIDSTFYIKKTNVKPIKEPFSWAIHEPAIEAETATFKSTITFSKPVTNLNMDSLLIEVDSTSTIKFTKDDIKINPQKKEMAVKKVLDKKMFGPESDPRLTFKAGKGFMYSVDGDTSKEQSTTIPILWQEDTGILHVQVQTREKDYLIQLLNKEGKLLSSVRNVTKYSFKNLPPTEYAIRVVIDRNKNGKWDPGYIGRGEEAEKVFFYTAPNGKSTFPMRANWEYGPLLIKF
jgi:uncharacterized protein (DUF2141 family)